MFTSYPKRLLLLFVAIVAFAYGEAKPAWLLISGDYEDSVMTLNKVEKDALVKLAWKVEAEGTVQSEAVAGSALLHRLIRSGPKGTDRMLESDIKAVDGWKKNGYTEEGLLGHVAATAGEDNLPVVQLTRGDKRLWLVQESSQKAAAEKGWKRSGVQFWLWRR